jgi:hypothetical protein
VAFVFHVASLFPALGRDGLFPAERRVYELKGEAANFFKACVESWNVGREGERTMIEPGRSKANRGRNLIAVLMAALGLLLLSGRPVRAQEWTKQDKPQKKQAKRRIIPVTINKGETFVISDVSEGGAPGVKPVSNPNALVVRTDAPGKIVLVGADAGNWNLDVTLASGEKVTYQVSVKALAPPQGDLNPGSAPTAIR